MTIEKSTFGNWLIWEYLSEVVVAPAFEGVLKHCENCETLFFIPKVNCSGVE
jgi:hypothetical protein